MTALFHGLSAFPLTPADDEGIVDTDGLGILIQRLVEAGVDSIGLLGSTGTYAYLDPAQRGRAVAAAAEAVAGRVPLIVSVGAMRTSWAKALAREAEHAGAAGLLLAPLSYTPLTEGEVARHFRAVAGTTALPLCIYNNPGTTHFTFSRALIAELAAIPNIAAIKMPLPADGDCAGELAALKRETPPGFAVGYSGDWGAAAALLAGGKAWYSVVAGLLPKPALRLTRAALEGRVDEAEMVNAAFQPLWGLFRAHSSLRIMYEIADCLSLQVGEPPAPLGRVDKTSAHAVGHALDTLMALPETAPPAR